MGFVRDIDCTKDTSLTFSQGIVPIYGKGIPIRPLVEGKQETESQRKIYLKELFPLEEYDKIIVLFSGGKDSIACVLKLLELGVPKEKLELWHHDIDGGHPDRKMDWPVTRAYVQSFAEAMEITLRISAREMGFFGELYRIGASEPIYWEEPENGEIMRCKPSKKYLECQELKEKATEDIEQLLISYGYRMKFPAKSGDLSKRWCSAYLKIAVADSVVSNLDSLGELEKVGGKRMRFPAKGSSQNGRWCSGSLKASVQDSVTSNCKETAREKKILFISGERRGESAGRAKYNEMEIGRTNAPGIKHRIVHHWRCVIDWTENDVWNILRRYNIAPHPCYRIGWPRCSCMTCIFSTPKLFCGIKELFPDVFESLCEDEKRLGFTIDNKTC